MALRFFKKATQQIRDASDNPRVIQATRQLPLRAKEGESQPYVGPVAQTPAQQMARWMNRFKNSPLKASVLQGLEDGRLRPEPLPRGPGADQEVLSRLTEQLVEGALTDGPAPKTIYAEVLLDASKNSRARRDKLLSHWRTAIPLLLREWLTRYEGPGYFVTEPRVRTRAKARLAQQIGYALRDGKTTHIPAQAEPAVRVAFGLPV